MTSAAQAAGVAVAAAVFAMAAAPAKAAAAAVPNAPPPEPLFVLSFDEDLNGMSSVNGRVAPIRATGVGLSHGVKGKSGVFTEANASRLEFPIEGNLNRDLGTVLMWVRRRWPIFEEKRWRTMFAMPGISSEGPGRIGTGQLWFWWNAHRLRCDLGDDDDTHLERALEADGDWHLYAFTWDGRGAKLYVDGKRTGSRRQPGASPIPEARRTPERLAFSKCISFDRFSIGSNGGEQFADAEIDELRIWDKPLSAESIAAIYGQERLENSESAALDWETWAAQCSPNPYEAPSRSEATAGGASNLELELIEEVRLDSEAALAALSASNRFSAVGGHAFRTCAGEPYLELGSCEFDRFALRFRLDGDAPLHCFEIDYPDDSRRTMGFLVQGVGETKWDGARCADYTMQVGVATGGEYPASGRILTHRCIYWTRTNDVALVAMTERDGAPAAVSSVRLYRIADGRLPVAGNVAGGSGRHFALYYEDPAIEYDFAAGWDTPAGFSEIIDRTAALMKFTAQDALFYPGAWYGGFIGDDYNPREHPRDFLSAWYAKFDREGLSFVPTVNIHDMSLPDGVLSRKALEDGSIHASALSIHADGTPGNGGTHNQLAGFNFLHPDVQAMLLCTIDTLVEQGAPHSSFKGVCLYLTRYNMLWFGDGEAGYNDYAVEAFSRETGIAVPVDRTDPLRGKAYHDWLRANAWDTWIDWRCRKVAQFWGEIACRMAQRRPDLKLWINSFVPPKPDWPDFMDEDIIPRHNREAGLDPALLESFASNIVIAQTQVPIGSRFWRADRYPSPAAVMRQQRLWSQKESWRLLDNVSFPWVHVHDLYFEDLGRAVKLRPLDAPWFKECEWQVVTVNPSGRDALRPFAEALKWHDVLGFSKGGFLIGTYGMEDVLVPFMRAFKALPPVVMRETRHVGPVVVREAEYCGRHFVYAVNASAEPAEIELPIGGAAIELSSGKTVASGAAIMLAPWELKSFSEPLKQQRNCKQ